MADLADAANLAGMVRHPPLSAGPMALAELPTPSLVLDLDVLERNLERMAERAKRLGVALRPHFKTHKCRAIADAQRRLGAVGWTVSNLDETAVLIGREEADLTWAFPVILDQVPRLARLVERAGQDATLRLVLDSPEALEALERVFADRPAAHVWLKVDCGYGRAGVDPRGRRALELARRLEGSRSLVFDGLLSHSGQAYAVRGRVELRRVAEEERRVMVELAERLRDEGAPVRGVSVGSTPATSAAEALDGVTEVRPGNYAFYDLTQVELGACGLSDCALTVLSSVVSSQPGARHSVIDAGALSLSKDPGPEWVDPPTYGRVLADDGRVELDSELRVTGLSQEHGILNAALPVGRKLRIVPNHSCLAVPCFAAYALARGDRIVGTLPIERDRKSWL